MKKKCRILSIFVAFIAVMACAITTIALILNKSNKKVYASSVSFASKSSGITMYIDNYLVLNNQLINISPSNCTFKPIFTIKPYGSADETIITDTKLKFNEEGTYILSCKVQSNKTYYTKDTISIKVVEDYTEASMYILKLSTQTIYVEDSISLSSVATINKPNNAYITFDCNECIIAGDETITAIKEGAATLGINICYDNITIFKDALIIVKPKTNESLIQLELSINNQVLSNSVVEISVSALSVNISYTLLNTDKQEITCTTESNIVSIIDYNSPNILLRPIATGEATICVSPVDYPNIIFEITIIIS